MMPGGVNVGRMALAAIGTTAVTYYRATGRTTNAIGLDVTAYADPVTARGSWQPVPRSLYQIQGLDLQKDYVDWITTDLLADLGRDVSGDQIERGGQRYQVQSATAWGDTAGFARFRIVAVPTPSEAP